MASTYWVLLLLLPAIWSHEAPKPENVNLEELSKLLKDVKAELGKLKKLEEELVKGKYAKSNSEDWQNDLSAPKLDRLEKDLGSATVQKCKDYAKQRSTDDNQIDFNRNFRYCVMSEKWTKSVPGHGATRRNDLKKLKNTMFDFDKPVDESLKYGYDCMYMRKKGLVVQIPDYQVECYWSGTTANRSAELHTFWKQAGPDFLYTYDFVLNTAQLDNPVENSLWYLLAYVRVIALELDNPMEIATAVKEPIIFKTLHQFALARFNVISKIVKIMLPKKLFAKLKNKIRGLGK